MGERPVGKTFLLWVSVFWIERLSGVIVRVVSHWYEMLFDGREVLICGLRALRLSWDVNDAADRALGP
jgi:hypothetical protein